MNNSPLDPPQIARFSESDDAADVLWGARTIARAINRTTRQTYHLISQGRLPVGRVGKIITASRKQLRAAVLQGKGP
jgi:hypothetical protein